MKIKTNIILISLVLIGALFAGILIIMKVNSLKDNALTKEQYFWKLIKKQNNIQKHDDSPVMIQGDNFVITKNEILIRAEILSLNGDGNNYIDLALQELIEKKALYAQALILGYTVSDSEVDDYIQLLRKEENGSQSYSDFKENLKGYGDEDTYWKEARNNLYVRMTIDKYIRDLRKEYATKKVPKNTGKFSDTYLTDNWDEIKGNIIEEIVRKENIIVKDAKYRLTGIEKYLN